jgi:ElaB/YqjD/DUF883 family membrane-anchored ribosome-binding protein
LHSTNWSNGEKKEWKLHSSKNNSIEDLVGNEENGYPVLDSNKTVINAINDPSDAHKKCLKEEIMEKILDTVNHKEQDELKKFQDTTNKELEKTQKQLNVLRENVNKYQSEIKVTIKKEI